MTALYALHALLLFLRCPVMLGVLTSAAVKIQKRLVVIRRCRRHEDIEAFLLRTLLGA